MIGEILAGITAAGTLATAGAVGVGVAQLRETGRQLAQTEQQAVTSFEDDLSREFRALVGKLPPEAFYEKGEVDLTDEVRRAFYRYFDLSNEQLFLARKGRIRPEINEQWRDGIAGNLRLPAFRRAWDEISTRVPEDFFEDLRALVPPAPQALERPQGLPAT